MNPLPVALREKKRIYRESIGGMIGTSDVQQMTSQFVFLR